jgi:hypothetical protein
MPQFVNILYCEQSTYIVTIVDLIPETPLQCSLFMIFFHLVFNFNDLSNYLYAKLLPFNIFLNSGVKFTASKKKS